MDKKIYIVLIIAALFAIVYFGAGLQTLQTQYTPKTPSDKDVWLGCHGSEPYKIKHICDSSIFVGGFDGGKLFWTSWFPTEVGQDVIVKVDPITYQIPWAGTLYQEGQNSYKGVSVGEYYWLVELDVGSQTYVVIDRDGIKLDPNGNAFAVLIDGSLSGEWTNVDSSWFEKPNFWDPKCWWDFQKDICEVGPWFHPTSLPDIPWGITGTENLRPPEGFVFRLIGPWDGTLRVTLYNERLSWTDYCWPNTHGGKSRGSPNPNYVVYQEADLTSTVGTITVLGETEQFEELETVVISMTTSWAGTVPNGWVFKMYDPMTNQPVPAPGGLKDNQGYLNYDSSVNGYRFGNELSDKRLYWEIPEGTFYSGIPNTWIFKLYNTQIQKNTAEVQVLIEGGKALAPGPTYITFDKPLSDYNVGDTIKMTTTCQANSHPDSARDVALTRLRIFTDPTNPIGSQVTGSPFEKAPVHMGDGVYEATFEWAVPTTSYYIFKAVSWDSDWLAGQQTERSGTIVEEGDPNKFSINVFVESEISGEPISGAIIHCSGKPPVRTTVTGTGNFHYLGPGTYTITVEHEKHITYRQSVTISNSNEDIIIRMKGALQLIPLLISILIAIIVIAIAYFLPIWDIRIKILIMVVGMALAAILYLFLSGILVFLL